MLSWALIIFLVGRAGGAVVNTDLRFPDAKTCKGAATEVWKPKLGVAEFGAVGVCVYVPPQ
jgi:hypothetical protein